MQPRLRNNLQEGDGVRCLCGKWVWFGDRRAWVTVHETIVMRTRPCRRCGRTLEIRARRHTVMCWDQPTTPDGQRMRECTRVGHLRVTFTERRGVPRWRRKCP